MRLRDMKQLLLNNIHDLSFEHRDSGSKKTEISNFQKSIKAIDNLKELKFLAEEINQLSQMDNIYFDRSEGDRIKIDDETFQVFYKIIDKVKEKCTAALEAIDQAIPDQDSLSISVKLPNYTNMEQLSKFFTQLNKSLEQAVSNEKTKDKITVQNFDSGSLWIELLVGSVITFKFIGSITHTAALIGKKIMDAQHHKEYLRSLKIKNDSLEDIQQALSKQLDALTEAETKNLLSKEKIEYDNEYLERMKYSIKTLAELINEGTEFQPSYLADKEDSKNFPDFSDLSRIESSIKHIISPDEDNKDE